MPERQLLHLVIGGELSDLDQNTFKDLSRVDIVGAYSSYDEAKAAWRAKSQATVDNALVRYFIIHAHKLLDPDAEDAEHEH
jgi:NADPH-dependent curcumin reductase CurA